MLKYIQLILTITIFIHSNSINDINHYMAQRDYKNGLYKEALEKFKKLPSSSIVNFEIASTLYRLKRYKEAIAYFKLANNPKLNGLVYYNIANCYFKLGDYNKAIELYKNATKFDNIKQKALKAIEISKKEKEIKFGSKIKECKGIAVGRGNNKAKIYKFDDPFISKDLKLAKLKDESKFNISNSKNIKDKVNIDYNITKSTKKGNKIYSLEHIREKRVNKKLNNQKSNTLLIPIEAKE